MFEVDIRWDHCIFQLNIPHCLDQRVYFSQCQQIVPHNPILDVTSVFPPNLELEA